MVQCPDHENPTHFVVGYSKKSMIYLLNHGIKSPLVVIFRLAVLAVIFLLWQNFRCNHI